MMRVVAIGGTGFIGRFVVAELVRMGHEVTVFHRGTHTIDGTRSIVGERRQLLKHADALRAVRPEVAIDFLISNGQGARELIEAVGGARLVMLSSCDVYRAAGILHGTEPGEPDAATISEESSLRMNLHPYPPAMMQMLRTAVYPWLEGDYDKIPAERAISAEGGTILRLPMIYGPGDPLHRFYPLVKRIDDGRTAMVMDESMARWRGIRGYVEDVAWSIALAASDERAAGRIYNVGDPENHTELEWRQQIAGAAGWKGRFVVVPDDQAPQHVKTRGNLRQHWAVDSSRIRRELGYRERVPRTEALRRTFAWERANPPAAVNPAEYDYAAEDAAISAVPASRASG
jgi:nucleoside-diphosphate-sugar epimerase